MDKIEAVATLKAHVEFLKNNKISYNEKIMEAIGFAMAILEAGSIEYEYAVFCWNIDKREYEQTSIPFQSELLAQNRFYEYVQKSLFIKSYDTGRAVMKRRMITTFIGEWEEISAEIRHVDEFEGKCGFAYTHEPFCNGGHNCRHPESAIEEIDGKAVGLCYAFSCPLAPMADEESFEKHGMDSEEFEDDMYLEVFNDWQQKKDEGLETLWKEFGDVPMNPETECIEEDWRGWKAGTFREDIWHWFDERHSKGVAYLM